jgi:2-keto-3-deoxy-L-rhamnonate aldolase RhmA
MPGSIRQRIQAQEPLLGVFLQLGSPVGADIAGRAGFDWALIDLEHGVGAEGDLMAQLLGLAASGVAGFVRVELASRLRIGRALDLGATGIMVPQVNDAALARQVVEWCQYPPAGSRGVALSARGAGYGRSKHEDVGRLDSEIVRIAQIETGTAVEAVDAIAAVDGIDVLFVGPSDLSHSLGVPGEFDHPKFGSALDSIADAARRHGCILGVHLPNVGELTRYRRLGFTFVSIAADTSGLMSFFTTAISAARLGDRMSSG